jgi:chromosomal replication initiator protein
LAIYLARVLTGASYQQIGRHFGGRDHTTVMHAYRRVQEQLDSDPEVQRIVKQLIVKLQGPNSTEAQECRSPTGSVTIC